MKRKLIIISNDALVREDIEYLKTKPCIKAHGSSDARAFRSAIKQAINYASSGTIEKIAEKLGK